MAKLILNPTSPARRDLMLTRSVLSIGRDPSNDLVLPDAMVSRRHAVIEYRGNQYFLRDCNSSNGSLVNGDRVSERGLRDGDLLAIGTMRLMFREDAEHAALGPRPVPRPSVPHPSAPHLSCSRCQTDYRKGDLFCRQCGERLPEPPTRAVCTACGTTVLLPARFCNTCGTALEVPGAPVAAPRGPEVPSSSVENTRLWPREAPRAVTGDAPGEPADGNQAAAEGRADHDWRGSVPGNQGRIAVAPVAVPRLGAERERTPRAALRAVPLPLTREAPLAGGDAAGSLRGGADAGPSAGPSVRLAAALIDVALVGAGVLLWTVLALLCLRYSGADSGPSFLGILAAVVFATAAVVCAAGYYVYFWGLRGATPGQHLLGLRVYGLDGCFPVGVRRALLRLLGYLLSAAAFGLGFVVVLFGATSLHDRVARTVVVREHAQ